LAFADWNIIADSLPFNSPTRRRESPAGRFAKDSGILVTNRSQDSQLQQLAVAGARIYKSEANGTIRAET